MKVSLSHLLRAFGTSIIGRRSFTRLPTASSEPRIGERKEREADREHKRAGLGLETQIGYSQSSGRRERSALINTQCVEDSLCESEART